MHFGYTLVKGEITLGDSFSLKLEIPASIYQTFTVVSARNTKHRTPKELQLVLHPCFIEQ